MRMLTCLLPIVLAAAAPSQITVTDVGLTLIGSSLTPLYGQYCGTVGCTPFTGRTLQLSQTLSLVHYAAPTSPFVIAIALPGPCIPFPGIANSVMLDLATVQTLSVGVTGSGGQITGCPQLTSRGAYTMTMPPSAPVPITFRFQSLGVSGSGMPAFGPALELTLL
jgi:hypothetical protein